MSNCDEGATAQCGTCGNLLPGASVRCSNCGVAPEAIDHPSHYGGENNPYEAIKVIEAWGLGFCLGNAVKYIARAGRKNSNGCDIASSTVEDLEKARWYIARRIEQLEQ